MSLENRVQILESKHQSLDAAFRDLMKVVAGTHEVVTLILKEQLEVRRELREFKEETRNNFQRIDSNFQRIDNNFEQIELLIRQTHSNH